MISLGSLGMGQNFFLYDVQADNGWLVLWKMTLNSITDILP